MAVDHACIAAEDNNNKIIIASVWLNIIKYTTHADKDMEVKYNTAMLAQY